MKSKLFSGRAFALHVSLILWEVMCAAAAWWQLGRAINGNSLSFMYAIEWPAFGVLGVLGWYALLNTEVVTEHQAKERREYEEVMRAQAQAARDASADPEDPALAAYNDHLAGLSSQPKKKIWGH